MESVAKALKFLEKEGHQVSRASFYRHMAEKKIEGPPFEAAKLLEYADLWIKEKKERHQHRSDMGKELKAAQLEKAKATAGYARLRTEQLRGDMIPLAEVERIYAVGGLRLKEALKAFGTIAPHEICDFFNGDRTKIQEFQWSWPAYVDKFMAEFFKAFHDGKLVKPDVKIGDILKKEFADDKARVKRDREFNEKRKGK